MSNTNQVWKSRPIFISSTFRDMHAERDYLGGHAFLRLGEQLRERCHYLDTIDLRQGVENAAEADEAQREMHVLKVCLSEIERSKPFLVALLGDRYGHIPPAERMAAAARDAGMPDSVEVAGKSVTELEILYGVLENPDQRKRSWFYFRTLDRTALPPEIAAQFPAEEASADPTAPAGRLRALKERIRREMPGRVREYTLRWDKAKGELSGLKEFDAQVAKDVWEDLQAETAAFLRDAPQTWQEAEARMVADFVAERTRGYVDRPAVTDPMVEHALSAAAPHTDWGLAITGESGGGKSCLFGRVYQALQPKHEAGEIVLLAHAAGIYPLSGQVDRMLWRWITELAVRLGVPDPLAALEAKAAQTPEAGPAESKLVTADQIEKTFAELLVRASEKQRVVVLMDALNQFEPTVRAEYLTWLPKPWPANARFIATAIPGQATAALQERKGCRERPVPPVTDAEAREIVRRFYRERHHRDVNPKVVNELLAKQLADGRPAYGNPLWLALALQEMNLLEADDFERADREYAQLPGAQRMQALQLEEARKLPADVPGVYGELLDRAERGFGKAWADAFVDLIAVSRAGWRESDVRELMPKVSGQPWDDLAFADVRRTLGAHVVQRGAQAQWDFFHAALRDTVLQRNLAGATLRQALHGLIADHLQALPAGDPLRISETMFHLVGLGDRDRAAVYLATLQPLQWSDVAAKSALAGAVSVLVVAVQAAPDDAARDRLAGWLADLMEGADDLRSGRVAKAVIFDLNDALKITGEARTERPRERLLVASQEILEELRARNPQSADYARDLAVSHERLGDLYRGLGNGAKALEFYEQSLALREELRARNPQSADYARDLAVSYWRMADISEKSGAGGATAWWRKAYDQLHGMQQRGIMLPTDEQYLATLKQKAGV